MCLFALNLPPWEQSALGNKQVGRPGGSGRGAASVSPERLPGSGSGPLGLYCPQSFHVATGSEPGLGVLPTAIHLPLSKKGEGGLLTPTNDLRVPDTGCAKPQ